MGCLRKGEWEKFVSFPNSLSRPTRYKLSEKGSADIIHDPDMFAFQGRLIVATARPSVRLSICPSVRLSVCPSVRLSVCPSVRLSICPSVRLSVCPSVRLYYVACPILIQPY